MILTGARTLTFSNLNSAPPSSYDRKRLDRLHAPLVPAILRKLHWLDTFLWSRSRMSLVLVCMRS